MRKSFKVLLLTSLVSILPEVVLATPVPLASKVLPSLNGIEIPANYKNWKLIGSSLRNDKNSLRVILGNSVAINAINNNQTNPWPDGTILAKLVWQAKQLPEWPEALVPGQFEHAEFMLKDDKKYSGTAGWGYARWLGLEQKPYGADENFARECLGCHTKVKANDYVFTIPAKLP